MPAPRIVPAYSRLAGMLRLTEAGNPFGGPPRERARINDLLSVRHHDGEGLILFRHRTNEQVVVLHEDGSSIVRLGFEPTRHDFDAQMQMQWRYLNQNVPFELRRTYKKVARTVYHPRSDVETIAEPGFDYESPANIEWVVSIDNEEELYRDGIVVSREDPFIRPATGRELAILLEPCPPAPAPQPPIREALNPSNYMRQAQWSEVSIRNAVHPFYDPSMPPAQSGRENILAVMSRGLTGPRTFPRYDYHVDEASGLCSVAVTAPATDLQRLNLDISTVGDHLGVLFRRTASGNFRADYSVRWAGPIPSPPPVAGWGISTMNPSREESEAPPQLATLADWQTFGVDEDENIRLAT